MTARLIISRKGTCREVLSRPSRLPLPDTRVAKPCRTPMYGASMKRFPARATAGTGWSLAGPPHTGKQLVATRSPLCRDSPSRLRFSDGERSSITVEVGSSTGSEAQEVWVMGGYREFGQGHRCTGDTEISAARRRGKPNRRAGSVSFGGRVPGRVISHGQPETTKRGGLPAKARPGLERLW